MTANLKWNRKCYAIVFVYKIKKIAYTSFQIFAVAHIYISRCSSVCIVRDLGIYVDSDVSMRTHARVQDRVQLLRHITPVAHAAFVGRRHKRYYILSLVVSLVLSRLDYGNATLAAVYTWQPARQTTVCDERRCTTCLLCAEVRAHHPATP